MLITSFRSETSLPPQPSEELEMRNSATCCSSGLSLTGIFLVNLLESQSNRVFLLAFLYAVVVDDPFPASLSSFSQCTSAKSPLLWKSRGAEGQSLISSSI